MADTNNDSFFNVNKLTTDNYRDAMAHAVGSTGTIARVTKMGFGDQGDIDSDGNPVPPTSTGPLNHVILVKNVNEITYPEPYTVCFRAEIDPGEITAEINEVALMDDDENTLAKIRLFNGKGVDEESGLVFKWKMEF